VSDSNEGVNENGAKSDNGNDEESEYDNDNINISDSNDRRSKVKSKFYKNSCNNINKINSTPSEIKSS
jgi:hypothetical protein